jgi:hypothetical protein
MKDSQTPNKNGDFIDWAAIGEEASKPGRGFVTSHFDLRPGPTPEPFHSIDRDEFEGYHKMLDTIFEGAILGPDSPACTHATDRRASSAVGGIDMRDNLQLSDKLYDFMKCMRDKLLRPKIRTWPEGVEPTERTEMILVRYKNWRGETRERHIKPIALVYGKTKWHQEPQWLVRAIDPEDGAKKSFALKDCDFTPASRQVAPMFTFNYAAAKIDPHVRETLRRYAGIRGKMSAPSGHDFDLVRMHNSDSCPRWKHPKVVELAHLFLVMEESFEFELVNSEFNPKGTRFRDLSPSLRQMAYTHTHILRAYMYARTAMYGFAPEDFDEAVRDTARRWRPESARPTPEGATMTILGMVVRVLKWPFQHR